MMTKRCFAVMLLPLLLFIAALPIQALAMERLIVEIPFTVENTPGTVVIEPLGSTPTPTVTEFQNVTAGSFVLTFANPGEYKYQIYQIVGNKSDITYDNTIYKVVVSVFFDENEELYAVVTLCIDDDTHKPVEIKFKNKIPGINPSTPTKPSSPADSKLPQTGVLWWPVPVLLSIGLMLCVTGYIVCRRRDHNEQA